MDGGMRPRWSSERRQFGLLLLTLSSTKFYKAVFAVANGNALRDRVPVPGVLDVVALLRDWLAGLTQAVTVLARIRVRRSSLFCVLVQLIEWRWVAGRVGFGS